MFSFYSFRAFNILIIFLVVKLLLIKILISGLKQQYLDMGVITTVAFYIMSTFKIRKVSDSFHPS
ncbi:MAG: hypothetical protein PHD05_07185, partial [Sphaerochaetaceae bacterium]|nr:hypothetical protein [Sphaerochaetaceae bacterium]